MDRIRVRLGEMPKMLREIIESAIDQAPDMSVVETAAPGELDASVDEAGADLLIVGLPASHSAAELEPLLYRHPSLQLLAIEGDGRFTSLYELRPHRVALGNLSPQGLVDAIRGAAHTNRGRR